MAVQAENFILAAHSPPRRVFSVGSVEAWADLLYAVPWLSRRVRIRATRPKSRQRCVSPTCNTACPYSFFCPAATLPPSCLASILHAIADPSTGRCFSYIYDGPWRRWVHRRAKAAGEDKSFGVEGGDFLPGRIVGHQLAIYVQFAYAAGDEQAVLRAEIYDDDGSRSAPDTSPFLR